MILLSLVGEQPIPNLLPLWQDPGRFHAVLYACTSKTEHIAENLRTCIADDPQLKEITVLPSLILPPYDIGDVRKLILHELTRQALNNETVCINLTGGTKVMSLATLQAAFGSGFPLIYVSTETGQIIHYQSDGSETYKEELNVHITIRQYMQAHGLESSLNPNFNEVLGRPFAPGKAGDWLEEKVEQLTRNSGYFDDVQRGLYIRKKQADISKINELDVVAIRNGSLVVCSCKTGENWSKSNNALYALSALSRREEAGIYCGKVMVTNASDPSDEVVQRARLDGIRIVYGNKVEQIADVMLQATGAG